MLNPQQKVAVAHNEWPLLINAWAWSGKTHTIIERMIRLILDKQALPEEIFAVTFTNKAAKEMKDRVMVRIRAEWIGWMPVMGTFHSLWARYLREYGNLLGYDRGFSIYDDGDSTKLMKAIFKEQDLESVGLDVSFLKDKIDKIKTYGVSVQNLEENVKKDMDRLIVDFYKEYQLRLFTDNAMDFNDLLLNFLCILEIPEVLNKFDKQFKFFFIDEYQDTNTIQYKIIKALATHTRNLCVIGDDYQSIYSFRNADMKNILNFTKDYPEAKTISLEQNYRSTKTIVNAANELIKKNTVRLDKRLFSMNADGSPIKIYNPANWYQEADYVAREIKKSKDYKKWAVLYRNNFISRSIENSLISNKIPYRIYGGLAFVERMEVKDIMGYINILVNKKDSNSFKRVINTPTRGLWAKSVAEILSIIWSEYAGDFHLAVSEPNKILNALPNKAKIGFQQFVNVMKTLIEIHESLPVGDIVMKAIEEAWYMEYLEKNYKGDELEDKVQNVMELVTMSKFYDVLPGYEWILEFVEKIALMQDANEHKSDNEDYVSLMTIHKSKGLEFDNVFVVAVEDWILPSKNANKIESIEEERRLMYVAMTRARHNLYLTFVDSRNVYGSNQSQFSSRFIRDIPEEYLFEEKSY